MRKESENVDIIELEKFYNERFGTSSIQIPPFLYHYSSYSCASGIIRQNDILLRFSDANSQRDENEGNILPYQEQALTMLEKDGVISGDEKNKLINSQTRGKWFYYHDTSCGIDIPEKENEWKTLILCFSYKPFDLDLFDDVVDICSPQKNKRDIVFEFDKSAFFYPEGNESILGGHSIEIKPVLYGEEAVGYLYRLIKGFKEEFTGEWGDVICKFLSTKVDNMKYFFKEKNYEIEGEYRILLFLPHKYLENDCIPRLNGSNNSKNGVMHCAIKRENGVDENDIFLPLHRAFRGISAKDLDKCQIKDLQELLLKNGFGNRILRKQIISSKDQ